MTLVLSSRQIVRHQIDVLLVPVSVQYYVVDQTLAQIKDIVVGQVAQIEDHQVREVLVVDPATRLEHSTSSILEIQFRILFHQLYKSK